MRRVACTLLLSALACGHRPSDADNPPSVVADAAGIPEQADAGTDAGSPTDAGATDACPQTPMLLWTRLVSNQFASQIATDENGNLYWLESDLTPHLSVVY